MSNNETRLAAKTYDTNLSEFRKLGIKDPVIRALKSLKFEKPTPIQEETIPLVLAGKDIIAGSATGSGKTLAFGTGMIQQSKPRQGIQALILTPTRELAEQVSENLSVFAKNLSLRIVPVYGGASINVQIKELRRAEIVVATPGRLLDHISRKTIRLDRVKTMVLDEADTMFDMGFIKDVEKIIQACPKQRQTLLFSATITNEVKSLAKRHTKNAANIMVKSFVDPGKLTQVTYDVANDAKFSLLVHLLESEESDLAMVFCNSRRGTDTVARRLKQKGIATKSIHGGFTQSKRKQAIKHFHARKVPVLICTDVAARGLDIEGVSHVYNYDIPRDSKQYIHRIGRTARAGKEGKAISIITKRDKDNFAKVIRDNALTVVKGKTPYLEKTRQKTFSAKQ